MSFDDLIISYYTTRNGFDNHLIYIYSSIEINSFSPSVYALFLTNASLSLCSSK